MKKSFILWIAMLTTCMASAQVSTWNGTHEPWTNGTGTEADPFLIENAQQLAYLAYQVNNGFEADENHVVGVGKHYKLMVDVDLNGSEDFQWTPIGYYVSSANYQTFGGHFDGNRHVVSGMYINSSNRYVGFFGTTDGATIQNLSIRGILIATTTEDYGYAGGIVGFSSSTKIIACDNTCNIASGDNLAGGDAGGIAGFTCGTAITNCYNTGNVSSYSSGGIVGRSWCGGCSTTISNCYNLGCVSASSIYGSCGGIIGLIDSETTIINNCFNEGNVFSSNSDNWSSSGGIVGRSMTGTNTITNCYNTGIVSSFYSGGIIGYNQTGCIVMNCYYFNNCGGNNNYGGQPISSEAMQTQEFVDLLNNGTCSWEYDGNNTNSGYPILTGIMVVSETLNATNITQSHATLRGNLEVETTNVYAQGFEYKKSTDSQYQIVNVSGNGYISQTLLGLIPNTEYVYRVFCTLTDCGTYYGEEKTFTTLPVSVTTYPATNVTATSAVLHGSMNIGDATLVSKGFIYFEDENPNSAVTIYAEGNDSDFTIQLTELQVNTTYIYQAFLNIAENPSTYYAPTGYSFEVSWLLQDTIYIYDVDMLHWVAEQCNSGTTFQGKCIKLMDDITLPLNVPNNMTSIGVYPNYPFKGTFDGNGKHITNLYIDQPNTPYQGFFGYTLNANLYNVGLVNITASGRNYTGGMVAYAKNTHMRDCYVNGGTLFALSYCGGLVGYQERGTNSIISGCYNTCEVTGNNYVGGLIGFSNYSTVRNSYVAGRVAAQGEPVGAIIGGANEVLMYYCYFSTDITGQTEAIGWNNIGKAGGEGLTNEQMRDPQFVNTLNQNLATPVWMADYATHINNGFPILQWQQGTGVNENGSLSVAVYPNPTNDHVTIEAEDLKHVTISNLLGQVVYEGKVEGDAFEYDFGRHGEGLYLIRIGTTSGVVTKKVSVTR